MKKKLLSILKSAKWLLWILLAGLGFAAVVFVKGLFSRKSASVGADGSWLPSVPGALRERVEAAEEDALRSRIEAGIKAEADKEELGRVMEIEDGTKRREALANLLRRL